MKRMMILLLATTVKAVAMGQLLPAIEITTNKTTSIVFPAAIEHADRGSENILVQKVERAGNILLIKAGKKDFDQTNLSVITADGKLYSFLVNYRDAPPAFTYYPTPADAVVTSRENQARQSIQFTGQLLPAPVMADYAKSILDNPAFIHNIHDKNFGLDAVLAGIYAKDEVLFLHIKVKNSSSVIYDIELVRLSIKDRRTANRTASQEREILPVYTVGNYKRIEPGKETAFVFAVQKFTIPLKQFLSIEILEQNGGRHLSMKAGNRKITKARPLPSYE